MIIRALRFTTSGKLRTATFRGAEHIVVPVVALVEGVIHASNADTPELVLASEFGKSVAAWNGRPAVFNHPIENGEPVSANSPRVLEGFQIGSVFDARIEGKKLMMEAWLNPALAPNDVVERLNAGKVVEVSVGVLVDAEPKLGIHQGSRYATIWRNIYPDHLAMLQDGTPGACDVKMGCGAPRAASARTADDGVSDGDVRDALWHALYAVVPALMTVVAVYPEAKAVIYCAYPDGEEVYYRRTYDDANGIILNDDAVQVQRAEEYTPVVDVASTTDDDEFLQESGVKTAAGSCGCGGKKDASTDITPAEGKEAKMKKELIAKILAAKGTCFSESDIKVLEQFDEAKLTAMADKLDAAPVEVEKIVEKIVEKEIPLTKDRVLAAFPDLKAVVEEKEARDQAQRATFVAAMKDNGVYTDAELASMPLPTLEKLVRVAGKHKPAGDVVDFAGRGTPRNNADTEEIPDAPNVHEMIRAARGIKK
jgi:hypothetical protein